MTQLTGRRYLVTGASKGIGLAIARELATRGARVAMTARGAERLAAAAVAVGGTPIVADVAVEDDCRRSVAEAVAALGGLDGLVNNAGIGAGGPLDELDVAEFRRVLDVNVVGAAVMTREVLPHLRHAGGGDVVNISSTSGLKGDAGATLYSASKFALRSMSQCWQAELRRHDIRVIHVNPSYVQTGFGESEEPATLTPWHLRADEIAHAVVGALTMDRRGFIPELTVFATNPWRGE